MAKQVALIPAYEPTGKLVELAQSLHKIGFEVVVVNDGSEERFKPVFQGLSDYANVISHETNWGKGRALKTGLSYISGQFPDSVIVTLDADGQHSIPDTIQVCAAAFDNPDSLVLGCRTFDKKVPLRSRFGNQVTKAVYRAATGSALSDTQTGLRAFSSAMIPFMLSIEGERYEYEMNVLLACTKNHVPMYEVKIQTIYYDNNSGSHFSTIKDSFRVYREIIKFAASSFIGFLTDYGVYALLVLVTGGLGTAVSIPLSNVTARVVSASVNYSINKRFVFKSKDSVVKTGAQYFALAAVILAGNTVLLSFLVNRLMMNRFGAKVITEIIFFTLSWTVQRFIIFRKRKETKPTLQDESAPVVDISEQVKLKNSYRLTASQKAYVSGGVHVDV